MANPAISQSVNRIEVSPAGRVSDRGHLLQRLPTLAAAATLAMLLAMTVATAISIRSINYTRSDTRFQELVDSVSLEVDAEFNKSLSELAAIKGFLEATDSVTPAQFRTFASALEQANWSVNALGFIKKVNADETAEFNRMMSLQINDDFSLESHGLNPYFLPVAFTYPETLGILNPGEDMLYHPTYTPLMNSAELERKIVASPPVPSASNPHDQAVVLVFTPVFKPSDDPFAAPELKGFGTGVYRVADFLAGPVERAGLGDIKFRVVDVEDGGTGQEVFPVPNGATNENWTGDTSFVSNLNLAGRNWRLEFNKPAGYGLSRLESQLWVIVLSAGLVITGLATASMYSLIADRQTAQSRLQLLTSRMNILLDSALESILLVGADDRIVWANRSYANVFGFGDPDSIIGSEWESTRLGAGVKFENSSKYLRRLSEINNNRELAVTSEDVQIKAPEARTLSMTSAPATSATSEYLGRLWVFRDVTNERTADRSKSEFISMVSHELRTPLTSLTGFIELVLDGAGGEVNPAMERLLKKAHANGIRLSRLVADILDISRLESGNLALEMSEVSLQGLVPELVEAMAPQFEDMRLDVTVNISSKLRAVWADRERCAQVFSNLLTNALRYTPEGGAIDVSAKQVGDQVEICVRDTGIGIRPENQARVFDKFVRLSRDGRRPPGSTGLGLAITKTLVELQGGSIRLESEYGKGSAFTISLPVAERPE
ncbi:MAG: CHASE domain-containing protein [Chloroflexi bacterium]|nr:CHASE domain-containing protein [Chloroflexota bacterium]